MLTIVDNCTRECPAIEADFSLGGLRVRRVLDRIASERGLPEAIVVDNGKRNFVDEPCRFGAKNVGYGWNSSSPASRRRTHTRNALAGGCAMNV